MKYCLLILLLSLAVNLFPQPQPPVRMVAEWEPASGTLVRWPLGIPSELVQELAADDTLYVLVADTGSQNSAAYTFSSWDVNMDHVVFIEAPTDSHWTRDWGPVSVFGGSGEWGIVDFIFEGYPWVPPLRNRWQDDTAVNSVLADFFAAPLYQMPLYFTGGNVMTDGYGSAFSSRQMLTENQPIAAPPQFFSTVETYTGVSNYQIVSNFESYGIQHIDCVAKLLNEETVLIKRLPQWHPDYNRVESVASEFAAMTSCFGRPYKIIRIDTASYSGNHTAAYTNSLILNNKVLVPLFGVVTDAEALQVYEQAMPGYEVIGFNWSGWYSYDALHCRTMGIFDRYMLRIAHRPLDPEIPNTSQILISAEIRAHSNEPLIDEEVKVFWKTEDLDWHSIVMTPAGGDSLSAVIPMPEPETIISYYIQAADESGRVETLPRTAPEACFSITVYSDTTAADDLLLPALFTLRNYPNPFNPETTIEIGTDVRSEVRIDVFNIKGQKIATVYNGDLETGLNRFVWNAETQKSGLYLIRVSSPDFSLTRKVLLLK
jgi:agmatine/peptidylarginine deiminase